MTTHVRLIGAGADGLGEDVSVMEEDGDLAARGAARAGARGRVDAGELLRPPRDARPVREAAGVGGDAALSPLGARVGRAGPGPAPSRSRPARGGGAGAAAAALRQLARPGQAAVDRSGAPPAVALSRSALQARRGGDLGAELVDEVAATGAVDTIDFKGQYGFEVEDPQALANLYDRVIAAFPDAYLEDPHDLPEVASRLGDHLHRVSYDSPIRTAEDIGSTPLAARVVNVKPSRIGSVRELLEVYARCAREGRPMYGGGMGELGVGRGQIELLAAIFHPDAPNDVAPSAYKEDDPAGELPGSPLDPSPRRAAFAGRCERVVLAASATP